MALNASPELTQRILATLADSLEFEDGEMDGLVAALLEISSINNPVLGETTDQATALPEPEPEPEPEDLIPFPDLKFTDIQKESYNIDMLGEDYKSLEFTDVFGDKVKVGEFLQESPDNMVVRIQDEGRNIWFETQKSGISSMKPLYPCREENRLGTVNEDIRYINLGRLGCPCQSVANYDAVMRIINSNLQIISLKSPNPPKKTKTLVSHEVLHDGEDWVSEAHCQDGTQATYYQTYQSNLLDEYEHDL